MPLEIDPFTFKHLTLSATNLTCKHLCSFLIHSNADNLSCFEVLKLMLAAHSNFHIADILY